jgi:hypothetical protein
MAIDYQRENTAMNNERASEDKAFTPSGAAAYLEIAWKRPFKAKDLTNFWWNNRDKLEALGIAPDTTEARMTLWKRSTLDIMIGAFPAGPELRKNHGKPASPRAKRNDA